MFEAIGKEALKLLEEQLIKQEPAFQELVVSELTKLSSLLGDYLLNKASDKPK